MSDNVSKKVIMFIAAIGSFITPFMGSSINIALPSLGNEFGMSAVLLSWVATSYLLAAAIFLVPFGRIADIYGRKRIYLYGISIFTASSILCGISNSAAMLISFRVLQGIGSAMMFGTGVAILTSAFPAGERGKALGINVAVIYLGLSLGPFLGGFMTQNLGWRSIFFVTVPLGLATIIFILWKLNQEWADAKEEKFDFTGSVIYGAALFGIIYGFSLLPELSGAWLIFAGAAGIVIFGIYEARAKNPVLDIKLFRGNRVFVFSSLAALINYSATFAVGFLLSLYLQYIKALSPQEAGIVLLVQPAVQAAFSPFAGRLSDRVQPRRVASAGMTLTAAGLSLLMFVHSETSLLFITVSLLILGFGLALFSSPNTNAVMSSVEKRFYGVASGILGTMRLTGQMFSMGIAMLVFAVYIGEVRITPEYYQLFLESARTVFVILTALCIIGIFASLARGKLDRSATENQA